MGQCPRAQSLPCSPAVGLSLGIFGKSQMKIAMSPMIAGGYDSYIKGGITISRYLLTVDYCMRDATATATATATLSK